MNTLLWGTLGLSGTDLLFMFLHFTLLSLLAVGGALTTAPDMQRYIVGERGWLTDAEFTGSVALAQAAPGPNVMFVAVIGWNIAGLAGLAAATVGSLLPSATLALGASRYLERHRDALAVRAFTTGMAPLTLGLLMATGWVLLEPARDHLATPVLAAAAVALMLKTKLSPLVPIALGALVGAMGWLG
jgi:chromate transporter